LDLAAPFVKGRLIGHQRRSSNPVHVHDADIRRRAAIGVNCSCAPLYLDLQPEFLPGAGGAKEGGRPPFQSSMSSIAPRKELLPKSMVAIISVFANNNLLVRTGASAPGWRLEHDFFVA
jgi:hypothetical protein